MAEIRGFWRKPRGSVRGLGSGVTSSFVSSAVLRGVVLLVAPVSRFRTAWMILPRRLLERVSRREDPTESLLLSLPPFPPLPSFPRFPPFPCLSVSRVNALPFPPKAPIRSLIPPLPPFPPFPRRPESPDPPLFAIRLAKPERPESPAPLLPPIRFDSPAPPEAPSRLDKPVRPAPPLPPSRAASPDPAAPAPAPSQNYFRIFIYSLTYQRVQPIPVESVDWPSWLVCPALS